MKTIKIALIGAGNLGMSIAKGLHSSGFLQANTITLTKRNIDSLPEAFSENVTITTDNELAAKGANVIILCTQPGQVAEVAREISPVTNPDQLVISAITGVHLDDLQSLFGAGQPIVRAMPNTAIAISESMTCLAANGKAKEGLALAKKIFDQLGQTMVIEENLMQAATVICASGTAFWMRYIRATCQGAVQLGFEAHDAQQLVMQTCLGAVKLLADNGTHPEQEVDKVTTPGGCTVKGLNEMEHQGLSSAIIKGLETSFNQINKIAKTVSET